MTEGGVLPVTLPDGTLLGGAVVNPANGWLRLIQVEPVAEPEALAMHLRVVDLERELGIAHRERDRWAAKFGRLQAAVLELKVEASDSEEELGADAWDPETHDFRQEEPGG